MALLLVSLYCTFFLILEVTRQKTKSLDDCPKGQLDYGLEHDIESPILLMAYLTMIAVTAALCHDSTSTVIPNALMILCWLNMIIRVCCLQARDCVYRLQMKYLDSFDTRGRGQRADTEPDLSFSQ